MVKQRAKKRIAMKNLYKIMTIGCFATMILSPDTILAKTKKDMSLYQTYQDEPQLFQAENGIMGKYWCKEKHRPAKAQIDDNEFINIVVIKTKQLQTKRAKKLRKHKDYLGFYISQKTNLEYNLYGINANPDPIDDGPDADVRTVIAIKQDYGIGE
jgi:hypothetical protein